MILHAGIAGKPFPAGISGFPASLSAERVSLFPVLLLPGAGKKIRSIRISFPFF
jgi:hypothetical protein